MARAKDFGAVGDGKTDDTEALQHAINDGDGALELTKGSFRITQSIVLDTTKCGYLGVHGKQGTARIVMDGAGPALKVIGEHHGTASPGSAKPTTWEHERFPVFSGFEILGKHPQADGIEFLYTIQATVQNVLIRRCNVGIRLRERNRNFLLNASHIYDCHDTGLLFDSCNLHQVIISSNHISYCKRAGIRQFNGDVHNIQITGNDIEYNSGFAEDVTTGEIVLEAPEAIISEYTIASNTIQATLDAPGANILVVGRQEEPPTSVRLLAITGNVLGSRDRNIVVQHGSRLTISGNTIYGGTSGNIELAETTDCAINGNTFVTRPLATKVQPADGIRINRCRRISITGNVVGETHAATEKEGGAILIAESDQVACSSNQISNADQRGVDIMDSQRCRISDNTIVDDRAKPTMQHAIRVSKSSDEILVNGNLISGTSGKAIVGIEAAGD